MFKLGVEKKSLITKEKPQPPPTYQMVRPLPAETRVTRHLLKMDRINASLFHEHGSSKTREGGREKK